MILRNKVYDLRKPTSISNDVASKVLFILQEYRIKIHITLLIILKQVQLELIELRMDQIVVEITEWLYQKQLIFNNK